jgi:hypothetical protein
LVVTLVGALRARVAVVEVEDEDARETDRLVLGFFTSLVLFSPTARGMYTTYCTIIIKVIHYPQICLKPLPSIL